MSIRTALFGPATDTWAEAGDRHLRKALELAEADLGRNAGEISVRLQLATAAHQRARLQVEQRPPLRR